MPTQTPSRRTVILSESAKISFSRCEMRMMPTFCFFRLRMSSKSRSASCSDREEVGSSMAMTLALKEMALMISTICCCAIVRRSRRVSGSKSRPKSASSSRARRFWAFLSTVQEVLPSSRPIKRFSAIERWGMSISSWCMMLTPCFCASSAPEKLCFSPEMQISPPSGW